MTESTFGRGLVIRVADTESRGDELASLTDEDVTACEVGPTGLSALEPLVMATESGETAYYTQCDETRIETVVSRVGETGDVTAADPDAVVEHDPAVTHLPTAEAAGIGTDARARGILGGCGWRRPTVPVDHDAAGGFQAHAAASVLEAGASIHGTGWGDSCQDEPVAETWRAVHDADGQTAVVVNGHGTAADALLLQSVPFEVLDGAASLATAVGAERVFVYVSAADAGVAQRVRSAVTQYPDCPVDIDVVTGEAVYRAAEPTMAIEAIEGTHRLEARVRPPGVEEVGLHGQPTLVHTPRTVARLSVTLRTGETDPTRVISVTGDVRDHQILELPETATLDTAVEQAAVTGELKAVCVGGQFGGITAGLDVALDAASLTDANLGTEGVVDVLTTDRCLVEFVGRQTTYAADENCGRCVPCREGTVQLAALLRRVYDGQYDAAGITELIEVMESSSICAFGVQAGRPAKTAMTEFESEFKAHANGQCPAGSCLDAIEV